MCFGGQKNWTRGQLLFMRPEKVLNFNCYLQTVAMNSVIRFDQISALWQNFVMGWVWYLAAFFHFGNIYATGQTFNEINGPKTEK